MAATTTTTVDADASALNGREERGGRTGNEVEWRGVGGGGGGVLIY